MRIDLLKPSIHWNTTNGTFHLNHHLIYFRQVVRYEAMSWRKVKQTS